MQVYTEVGDLRGGFPLSVKFAATKKMQKQKHTQYSHAQFTSGLKSQRVYCTVQILMEVLTFWEVSGMSMCFMTSTHCIIGAVLQSCFLNNAQTPHTYVGYKI